MKPQPFSTDKVTLRGQNLLFLSLPKHDGPYTSTPWQISAQLSSIHRVIFVDHPYTFLDLITGFYKPAIRKRLQAWLRDDSVKKNNVDVILPPFIWPINFLPKGKVYNFFSKWNHRILAKRINRFLQKNNIDGLVYINSFNFYFPELHHYLDAQVNLNIYHCIDPMVKAFTLKHGHYLQENAANEADAIVCTAPALKKNFIDRGFSKVFVVPNAANFDLFHRATNALSVHEKLNEVQGKVLGYLGNIERRTDFNLLNQLMTRLPDWHLVMAGPVERQYVPVEFFNHNRIHFIGSIAHADAPSVVKRFDVAIIPFKCDEVSSGIYPLKLFEYLAAGKPVVTTNFNPEVLNELADVVYIGETSQEFAKKVLLAYATDSDAERKKRIAVAAQNTWEERAQLFNSIISIEFKNKISHVA